MPVRKVPNLEALAQILGCKISMGESELGSRFKSKEIWNSILEKMERRIAG